VKREQQRQHETQVHLPVQMLVQVHRQVPLAEVLRTIQEPQEQQRHKPLAAEAVVAEATRQVQREQRRRQQHKRYKPPAMVVLGPETTTRLP